MTTMLEAPVRRATGAGLCSTCDHAPYCTHPREHGVPILECDDASSLTIAVAHPTGVAPRARLVPPDRAAEAGLCATCVHRPGCTYPKPEGGVWRCEEFE